MGARFSNCLAGNNRLRLSDAIFLKSFWEQRKYKDIFLSHDHPFQEFADIIKTHPQYIALCNKDTPDNLPLKMQIRILDKFFGGGGHIIINEEIIKKVGIDEARKLGERQNTWDSKDNRPILSDAKEMISFWKGRTTKDIWLSLDYPYPPFGLALTRHPQYLELCNGMDVNNLSMKSQLDLLHSFCGGYVYIKRDLELIQKFGDEEIRLSGIRIGNAAIYGYRLNISDAERAALFWMNRDISEFRIARDCSLKILTDLILLQVQLVPSCGSQNPYSLCFDKQFNILKDHLGGLTALGNDKKLIDLLGNKETKKMSSRLRSSNDNQQRPKLSDIQYLVDFWSRRQVPLYLNKPLPKLAAAIGDSNPDKTALRQLLPRLASRHTLSQASQMLRPFEPWYECILQEVGTKTKDEIRIGLANYDSLALK